MNRALRICVILVASLLSIGCSQRPCPFTTLDNLQASAQSAGPGRIQVVFSVNVTWPAMCTEEDAMAGVAASYLSVGTTINLGEGLFSTATKEPGVESCTITVFVASTASLLSKIVCFTPEALPSPPPRSGPGQGANSGGGNCGGINSSCGGGGDPLGQSNPQPGGMPNSGGPGTQGGGGNSAPPGGNPPNSCQAPPCIPGLTPDPVVIETGELTLSELDAAYRLPGGEPFRALRTYRAKDRSKKGWFGLGWRFPYERRVEFADRALVETDGTGGTFVYPAAEVDENLQFETDLFSRARVTYQPEAATVTLQQPGGIRITYGLLTGAMKSVLDLHGNGFFVDFNSGGLPDTIRDSVGRAVTLEANAQGLVSRMILPDASAWEYAYSSRDELVSVKDAKGNVTMYLYGPEPGLITGRVNAKAESMHWEFDSLGRVTRVVNEAGAPTTFTYLTSPTRTVIRDSLNHAWTYTFDGNGFPTDVVWPDGASWHNTFTADGRVTSIRDPALRTTTFEYGDQGFLTRSIQSGGTERSWARATPTGVANARTNEDGTVSSAVIDTQGRAASLTDSTQRTTTYLRDARGQVTRETDPSGAFSVFEYDPYGNLIRSTDAQGHLTTYSYDILGRLRTVTDPAGRTTTYAYWLHDRIATETDHLGRTRTTEYDSIYNPIRSVDEEGRESLQAWRTINGVRLQSSRQDPEGHVSTYEHDTEGRAFAQVDPRGARTETYRDVAGRPVRVKDALGFERVTEWNQDGTIHRQIDPLGHPTTFLYDDHGRVERVVDARGKIRQTIYNTRGAVVATIDEAGNQTQFFVDSEGRQTKVVDAEGRVTESFFDSRGLVNRTKDPRGHETIFVLDELGRPKEVRYPDTGVAKTFWNDEGQVIRTVDPMGRENLTEYDILGRVEKRIGPSGEETSFTYTPSGQIASVTDPDGRTTWKRYDRRGLLTETEDPLGHVVRRSYDEVGNLTSITDENGSATTFRYDLLNRLEAVVDSLGRETRHTYDAAGRRLTTTNARGHVTAFSYDELGRLVSRSTPEGQETFVYDDLGRRVRKTNSALDEITLFDRIGRETGRIDLTRGFTLSHDFDLAGNPTTSTDSLGRTVHRTFDSMNRLVTLATQEGSGYAMSYNLAGQLTQRSGEVRGIESYTFDASGRVQALEVRRFSDQSLVIGFEYFYSPGGDRIREIESRPGGVMIETVYEYNARHELTRALVTSPGGASFKGFGEMTWTYDPAGNRITQTRDGVSQTITYDVLNQVATVDGRSAQFDLDGNMLREPLDATRDRIYDWDSQNRMIRTAVATGSPGSETFEDVFSYRYDPDSLRITAIEEPDASAPSRPRNVEHRFLAGGQIIEGRLHVEGEEAARSETRRYIRAGAQVLEEKQASILAGSVTTGSSFFYLQDVLGSTVGQIESTPGSPGTLDPVSLISVSVTGDQANGPTFDPAISDDGRFIAFLAFPQTNNLAPGDTNAQRDVYLKDRQSGAVERISSPAYPGMFDQGDGPVRISATGRYVLFSSFSFNPFPFVRPILTLRDRQLGTTSPILGGDYHAADLSDDGRYLVVLASTNYGSPLDQNGAPDVWTFDTQTITFDLISHGPASSGSNHGAFGAPSISADGRYVAFSSANALVPGDTNGFNDIYVKDRQTGDLILASTTSAGLQADGHSGGPTISSNGRWVAFTSTATNLAPGDTRFQDVFLKDLITGTLVKVSEGQGTNASGESSFGPISISEDGRFVTYTANDIANQVPGDNNAVEDVFLLTRDVATSSTTRISVTTSGAQGNGGSGAAAMSNDGRWIAFASAATNFVANDINGQQDIFVAPNPKLGGTGGPATVGEAQLMSYTPYGEQTAGPGARFTFTGLANESLGGASDSMLAATYRAYRPGLGRWPNRDPAGDVDGPNRFLYVRNNPLQFVDPSGLFLFTFAGGLPYQQGLGLHFNPPPSPQGSGDLSKRLGLSHMAGVKDFTALEAEQAAQRANEILSQPDGCNEPVLVVSYSRGFRTASDFAGRLKALRRGKSPVVDLFIVIDAFDEWGLASWNTGKGHLQSPASLDSELFSKVENFRQENDIPMWNGFNLGTVQHSLGLAWTGYKISNDPSDDVFRLDGVNHLNFPENGQLRSAVLNRLLQHLRDPN